MCQLFLYMSHNMHDIHKYAFYSFFKDNLEYDPPHNLRITLQMSSKPQYMNHNYSKCINILCKYLHQNNNDLLHTFFYTLIC